MPLRIDLAVGNPAAYRSAIADVVYEAMRPTVDIPPGDRFAIVTEHAASDFVYDAATSASTQRGLHPHSSDARRRPNRRSKTVVV